MYPGTGQKSRKITLINRAAFWGGGGTPQKTFVMTSGPPDLITGV